MAAATLGSSHWERSELFSENFMSRERDRFLSRGSVPPFVLNLGPTFVKWRRQTLTYYCNSNCLSQFPAKSSALKFCVNVNDYRSPIIPAIRLPFFLRTGLISSDYIAFRSFPDGARFHDIRFFDVILL